MSLVSGFKYENFWAKIGKTKIWENKKQKLLGAEIDRTLTLFRMGFFGAAHGWWGGFLAPLPKIRHTYSTIMKLDTIIP